MLNQIPFLSVRGIRKSFGPVKVLHGVDLDLMKGSVTALLGENGAGKSTFVRILAGDHKSDQGTIALDGKNVDFRSVSQARAAGIRLIAQEIADAPPLTVAENVSLGAPPARWGFIDHRAMHQQAREALDALGADIPLTAKVENLRLGERQILEIARSTIGVSKCVIFDEPTAALSDAETQRLFELIARMKENGVAILYITHRLDEVFEIADRVCVLRDGLVALEEKISDVTQPEVVKAMVGRDLRNDRAVYAKRKTSATPILEVRQLTSDVFTEVELNVSPGEIVGIYGKIGSGVPELAATLFGARPYIGGSVIFEGEKVNFRHPAEAVERGIGYLPADRASEGLLRTRTAAENLAAPSWKRLKKRGIIAREAEEAAFGRWHNALQIRSSAEGSEPILTLSGGNQQKVLLGRWLENNSKLLVLVEPTRGVDVGARLEIYKVLRDLAEKGHGILIATSDYEDVVHAATRAIVMVRGRIVSQFDENDISVSRLTEAAGGSLHA